jgi:hypothetical protein
MDPGKVNLSVLSTRTVVAQIGCCSTLELAAENSVLGKPRWHVRLPRWSPLDWLEGVLL